MGAVSATRSKPRISIVIAARDAERTLRGTLGSLAAQTFREWEALVVDDGSVDATAGIVSQAAEEDPRIRIVSRPPAGVSAARNAGIADSRADWLLFLDADDLLRTEALAHLLAAVEADAACAAAYCAWARVDEGGTILVEQPARVSGDLFEAFTRTCLFASHSCLVRRALVEAVGGFDTGLRSCEDWDLWQRISRTGARFAAVDRVLALYVTRSDSASMNLAQLVRDGVLTIERGHAPDPRVRQPSRRHPSGAPPDGLPEAKVGFVLWTAALALGKHEDPRALLAGTGGDLDPLLSPALVADSIYLGTPIGAVRPIAAWPDFWPRFTTAIGDLLAHLEHASGALRLAARAERLLERRIVEGAPASRLQIGRTIRRPVECTDPIRDITAAADVVVCDVRLRGTRLGSLELPICDGLVSARVVADAVAHRFGWAILGAFLERTVYPDLEFRRTDGRLVVARGAVVLGGDQADTVDELRRELHDRVGWAVFLQELWGRPDLAENSFYERSPKLHRHERVVDAVDGRTTVEVSSEPAAIAVGADELELQMSVGGAIIGTTFLSGGRIIPYAEIRTAVTLAGAFELCRAAVREGLLGAALDGGLALRARLAGAARRERKPVERALSPRRSGIVLARRTPTVIGTSASRHAGLPTEAGGDLVATARALREAVVELGAGEEDASAIVYSPDVVVAVERDARIRGQEPSGRTRRRVSDAAVRPYDRASFESLFAASPDPWNYDNAYEQAKYEQTLALIPQERLPRALEIGCAEGHFTVQLAPRVESLLAADISEIALERAAERCASHEHVSFAQLDLVADPLPGPFDLIVCSEILYFAGDRADLGRVARKLADALAPGGLLVTAHANLVADDPHAPGFAWQMQYGAKVIGQTLAKTRPLRLIREIRTPLYRIQLLRRAPRWSRRPDVEILEAEPGALPEELAKDVRWDGGKLEGPIGEPAVVTARLPILLYHRITSSGGDHRTAPYRLAPEAFERQLRYLSDTGYRSVDLEEWRGALDRKVPLPERAVVITFDDGYSDFRDAAWPLLDRYGFTAIVFLVSGEIGGVNRWDAALGDEFPLLDWPDIRALRDAGVRFGSHGETHRPLTGLSHVDVVREATRSRAALEVGLGRRVDAFAYPYGDVDPASMQLVGACGYTFGLTSRRGPSVLVDAPLDLPRIEVSGTMPFDAFVRSLGA
jgi:peptidoglycan/xylan/chitin deacetylase (PgdA/CDA1 family)/SAM-dependent methyltransferase